ALDRRGRRPDEPAGAVGVLARSAAVGLLRRGRRHCRRPDHDLVAATTPARRGRGAQRRRGLSSHGVRCEQLNATVTGASMDRSTSPLLVETPPEMSIPDLLADWAAQEPDRTLLEKPGPNDSWTPISAAQMHQRVGA